VSSIFLQSISSPVKATVLSLVRDVIVFVPLTIFLPIGLGIEGVLWAAPISDSIAIVFTFILVFLELRKLEKNNQVKEYSYSLEK
jgi:Na+-driven multidrug efflux pump